MRLCLGTAQFGMAYGISNSIGQVNLEEAKNIVEVAKELGINTIDTAQGYSESESVLGKLNLSGFKIVTKISGTGDIKDSQKALNTADLYAVLLHNENDVSDGTLDKLNEYKRRGFAQKIGVSVYSPKKLSEIIQKYRIDIVQLPLNILDQRFIPLFHNLKELGIEIHIRSVFLQGLLLMPIENVPAYFDSVKNILEKLPKDKLGFALNFAKSIKEADKIVVGVTSAKELRQICESYNKGIDYSGYKIDEEKIVNPSMWRKVR